MNRFGRPIPAEKCLDCITVAGQSYCTMNCGPCVPPKKEIKRANDPAQNSAEAVIQAYPAIRRP
jgi:hypothetical protein